MLWPSKGKLVVVPMAMTISHSMTSVEKITSDKHVSLGTVAIGGKTVSFYVSPLHKDVTMDKNDRHTTDNKATKKDGFITPWQFVVGTTDLSKANMKLNKETLKGMGPTASINIPSMTNTKALKVGDTLRFFESKHEDLVLPAAKKAKRS
jgi:hypothetical protein